MKERLISLAWAIPWMLFMGFPLAYALELTDTAQRAGIIGLCALLAVTNSVTWLTNPPARAQLLHEAVHPLPRGAGGGDGRLPRVRGFRRHPLTRSC